MSRHDFLGHRFRLTEHDTIRNRLPVAVATQHPKKFIKDADFVSGCSFSDTISGLCSESLLSNGLYPHIFAGHYNRNAYAGSSATSGLGESVPTLASDSCFWITGVESDLVLCCRSPSESRFSVLRDAFALTMVVKTGWVTFCQRCLFSSDLCVILFFYMYSQPQNYKYKRDHSLIIVIYVTNVLTPLLHVSIKCKQMSICGGKKKKNPFLKLLSGSRNFTGPLYACKIIYFYFFPPIHHNEENQTISWWCMVLMN